MLFRDDKGRFKKGIIPYNKGKKYTQKIRKCYEKYWNNLKNRKQTKQEKQKRSKSMKKYYETTKNPKAGFQKGVALRKGVKLSKNIRRKISKSNKGKKAWNDGKKDIYSQETIEKIREATIKSLKNRNCISKGELILKKYLINNKINLISQFPYKLGLADFYLPNKNLIIECYGEYWHNLPNYKEKDIIKNNWLQDNGYNVLIYWTEDITENKNELNKIIDLNILK